MHYKECLCEYVYLHMAKCIKTLRCAWTSVNDCKMSYFTLLFLALGTLSSFMLREVTALRLPLPDDSDPDRFTWGQFPEVSALYSFFFFTSFTILGWNIQYVWNCGYRVNVLS